MARRQIAVDNSERTYDRNGDGRGLRSARISLSASSKLVKKQTAYSAGLGASGTGRVSVARICSAHKATVGSSWLSSFN